MSVTIFVKSNKDFVDAVLLQLKQIFSIELDEFEGPSALSGWDIASIDIWARSNIKHHKEYTPFPKEN